jgi:hypothetical protein
VVTFIKIVVDYHLIQDLILSGIGAVVKVKINSAYSFDMLSG